jgi:arylsulfatase A-like enzyme
MKRGLWIGGALAGLVLLGFGGVALKDYVILHIAGWRGPKVGPHREVVWQAGPSTPTAAPADRPPNIIVILADDLGFNDISLNGGLGNGTVRTPNIDGLAQTGAVLATGYAGNATCSPSRAALMTGRYPTRFGFEFTAVPVQLAQLIPTLAPRDDGPRPVFRKDRVAETPPYEQMGVPTTEITLAELLRGRGYHTLHLGKWHLGETDGMRPEDQGFDESLGFMVGAQMFLPANDPNVVNSRQDFDPIDKFLWANLPYSVQYNGGERFHPDAYMTDYLTDEALAGIRANRNRPFFMYLAYNAPHTPLQALKSDYDALSHITNHRERVYAAMIVALDRGVGRIMAELKAQGLDENTLVVFTSDNGGANYLGLPQINKPFRGWKLTFFEGGIRVPYMMHWPSRIPAGARLAAPVSHFDIYATAAAAAGAALPTDRRMDGVDLTPFLSGQAPGRPHQSLFWRSGGYRVVRSGDWKLQVLDRPSRTWLFDLATDPTEQRDLSARRPDVVAALKAELEAHNARQGRTMWPALVEAPVGVDRTGEERIQPGDTYVTWSN